MVKKMLAGKFKIGESVGLVLISILALNCAHAAIVPSNASEVLHVTKDEPIVVHTALQNYDQPTLKDYEECHSNRDQCVKVCGDENQKCLNECPICPELYDHPVVIQGVNDTKGVGSDIPLTPVNTTNIIRLTNEINNVIESDINNRVENNVKVYQNVSQVGGNFGLGYNEHGSCCYVVRRLRECEDKENCREQSRQLVCGERCQARVMLARRVTSCDVEQPDKCHETIEYVPAHRHRRRHRNQNVDNQNTPRCQYLGNWPYVSCNGNGQSARAKRATCQRCLELPYGYILESGLPSQCHGCFNGFVGPLMPMWYPPYNYGRPPWSNEDYTWDKKPDKDDEGGWTLETQKCLSENGTVVDCTPISSGDLQEVPSKPILPEDKEDVPVNKDDDYSDEGDAGWGVPAQRHRRHSRQNQRRKFIRSAYSLRHKKSKKSKRIGFSDDMNI